jgi:DNA-binding transcriptional LysR family regulator
MAHGDGGAAARKPPRFDDRVALQRLRSFCTAVRAGSFSRAGEVLGVSQPTVSLHIQALEQLFKTPLFSRRGPKVHLTPEGQALYARAWPLVQGVDALHATFPADWRQAPSGWLNLAAGESTILYLLPPLIKEFATRYPAVELRLHNVTGREGLKLLRGDGADFAVGPMAEVPDDILYCPLFTFRPVLIAPLGHKLAGKKRITVSDIARYPLVLPPRHHTTWRMVDYLFQKHNLTYRVALEGGGWEVVKKYVEVGIGISIVTSLCLRGDEKLVTADVGRYFPPRSYGIVQRKHRPLSAQASCFIELMKRRGPGGKGEG